MLYLRVFDNNTNFLDSSKEDRLVGISSIMKVKVLEGPHQNRVLWDVRRSLLREL